METGYKPEQGSPEKGGNYWWVWSACGTGRGAQSDPLLIQVTLEIEPASIKLGDRSVPPVIRGRGRAFRLAIIKNRWRRVETYANRARQVALKPSAAAAARRAFVLGSKRSRSKSLWTEAQGPKGLAPEKRAGFTMTDRQRFSGIRKAESPYAPARAASALLRHASGRGTALRELVSKHTATLLSVAACSPRLRLIIS